MEFCKMSFSTDLFVSPRTRTESNVTTAAWRLLRALGRRLATPRLRCYRACKPFFQGKTGLEVGGPSEVFSRSGPFPVYPIASRIDDCNFSRLTVWEGAIQEGATFRYDENHAPGRQYIAEAVNLAFIPSESYDFVLSSHTLEHTANPLLALSEWLRVIRELGMLLLVVPHKDGTFDHRRPVTTLEHLLRDFERGTTEEDLTHLPEILKLHDLARDPEAGDFQTFKRRSERNHENRCLHHHVFDTSLAIEIIDHMGLQIHATEVVRPFHIFIIAQKLANGQDPQNERFTGRDAEYRRRSRFASDRW
jgi:SAM-dependent methyltransferase